jgi:hypothetical protein
MDTITHEIRQAANKVALEIRSLLRALGPKDTKRRKVLQAKLRLVTNHSTPLDMRELAHKRFEALLQHRSDAGSRRVLARYNRGKHALRVRLPLAHEGRVADTRTDADGKALYIELPNGQIINTARILGSRLSTGRMDNHAKRRRLFSPLKNPVLVNIARAELKTNAERETK